MFEITKNDLLARIGKLTTKSGTVLTPAFVPVVHPEAKKNLVNVETFFPEIGIDIIITSSYILRKEFFEKIVDLREITGFSDTIMTDSGAYQSLVYGEVEITPKNAITFQEQLNTDIGVPLDIPIALKDSYVTAKEKVLTTIQRCKEAGKYISEKDILWACPIQGGKYASLVEYSAKKLTESPQYDMFAIGSVVELMSNYQFDVLLQSILTAKKYLDPSKPVHLFGAGHPMIFPLIVAAGCDSFDSAAYALYAQEGRYFTSTQTYLLENLEEFPCSCSICNQYTPTELLQQNKNEQKKALAKHNLYVCQAEMRLIREAIRTGSLWELIEKRALAHPLIKRGFNILKNQSQIFIKNTPFSKQKGIFMVSNNSIVRPEVLAHKKKIGNILQKKKKNLLLISLLDIVIDDTFNFLQQINSLVAKEKVFLTEYEIWILDDYFGIIPLELIEVFPLIQYLGSNDLSKLSREKNLQIIMKHIKQNSFDKIIGIGNLRLFNKYYQKKPIFQKRNLIIETYNCTNFDDFLLEIKLIIEEL